MNANTGVWIGLGVLGVLIIATMDNETKIETKSTDKPKVEPKKVQL